MKFVKADKPISTEHKTLGEIKVDVEVPQLDGEGDDTGFLQEFVAFSGGAKNARDYLNKAIENDAKAAGRIALRAIPDGSDLETATPRIAGIVKNFTPQSADGREVRAKKVQAFDALSALLNSSAEVSREDLLKMLEAAK